MSVQPCGRCGAAVRPGDRFCPNCGAAQLAATGQLPQPPVAAPAAVAPARPRRSCLGSCFLTLLVVCGLLTVAGVLGVWLNRDRVRETLELLDGGISSEQPRSTAEYPGFASGSGVVVPQPGGWAAGDDGSGTLVVAALGTDVERAVPSGPRLLVSRAPQGPLDATALIASEIPEGADPATLAARLDVVEESAFVTVGDSQGVAITLREEREGRWLVRRLVTVGRDGTAYQFTLEAPEEQWEAGRATLEQLLRDVRFS